MLIPASSPNNLDFMKPPHPQAHQQLDHFLDPGWGQPVIFWTTQPIYGCKKELGKGYVYTFIFRFFAYCGSDPRRCDLCTGTDFRNRKTKSKNPIRKTF